MLPTKLTWEDGCPPHEAQPEPEGRAGCSDAHDRDELGCSFPEQKPLPALERAVLEGDQGILRQQDKFLQWQELADPDINCE